MLSAKEIQNLLWWPENPNPAAHHCSRNAEGALLVDDKIIKTPAEFLAARQNPIATLNFSIDHARAGLHIEDMVSLKDSFCYPGCWTATEGLYRTATLSLRVMGYLVDCWKVTNVAVGQRFISFDLDTTHIGLSIPPGEFTRNPMGITAKFAQWLNYTPDGSWTAMKYVHYGYLVQDQDPEQVMQYFRQHPRNFFLSAIRQSTLWDHKNK